MAAEAWDILREPLAPSRPSEAASPHPFAPGSQRKFLLGKMEYSDKRSYPKHRTLIESRRRTISSIQDSVFTGQVTMISPVHFDVKTTVPAKSTGRMIDAITDLIRPITERRGLKGDMIRLQREEVALKIAKIAMARVSLEKGEVQEVPLKILVPLLEKSSLEAGNDKLMVNLWANLLATAAMGQQNNIPRYISILSEINGQQARIVQKILVKNPAKLTRLKLKISSETILENMWSADQAGVLLALRQDSAGSDVDKIFNIVRNQLDLEGIALTDIILNQGTDQWDGRPADLKGIYFPTDEHQIDIDALENLNLLKDMTFKGVPYEGYELSVFYYKVTPLCVDMFSACNPDLFEPRRR